MFSEELMTIENLLNSILNNKPIKQDFKTNRILFNRITINNILKNAQNKEQINFKKMLSDSSHPLIESKYPNENVLYDWLIEALEKGEYEFTKAQEIYISSDKIEMIIPIDWLYHLSISLKPTAAVYLFRKKKMRKISSPEELEKYLQECKTIYVEYSNTEENQKIFSKTEEYLNMSLKLNDIISATEIYESFKKVMPSSSVCKCNPSTIDLLRKANQKAINFYKQPFYVQENYLKDWIVSQIQNNQISSEYTQMYLLSGENKNKERVISGLTSLYFSLLNKVNIDYSNLSLSEFNIKVYQSNNQQQKRIELANIIKNINSGINNKDMQNIRKTLQNQIIYSQEQDLLDIAFNNEKIGKMLETCAIKGTVRTSEFDKNKIIFELKRGELTNPTFISTINNKKLLEFIKNNNLLIKEQTTLGKKVA